MEANEANEATEPSLEIQSSASEGRGLRIFVGVVTLIALSPVLGMVLAFAILPALPIVLAIGFVLGPINWLEDREVGEELEEEGSQEHGHGHWTHAHA